MDLRSRLNRVRSFVSENRSVRALLALKQGIAHRWLAVCFARRFYRQARDGDAVAPPPSAPATDFTESLFRRSVPPKLHALVQLRVASRLGSIAETQARSQLCRELGWSTEKIGAALLGHLNGTFSEPERLVLRFADDMSRTPIDVDPQVVRELRSFFTHGELLELTASIAHENFRTRFADAGQRLR